MAQFEQALAQVLPNEGGYVNDPKDAGGETYKGISRHNFPLWYGWTVIDKAKSEPDFPKCLENDEALQSIVSAFYQNEFWDKIHGDQINDQTTANELFNSAVNTGIVPSVKMMQASAGVPETGIMDEATLNSLNNIA